MSAGGGDWRGRQVPLGVQTLLLQETATDAREGKSSHPPGQNQCSQTLAGCVASQASDANSALCVTQWFVCVVGGCDLWGALED